MAQLIAKSSRSRFLQILFTWALPCLIVQLAKKYDMLEFQNTNVRKKEYQKEIQMLENMFKKYGGKKII